MGLAIWSNSITRSALYRLLIAQPEFKLALLAGHLWSLQHTHISGDDARQPGRTLACRTGNVLRPCHFSSNGA